MKMNKGCPLFQLNVDCYDGCLYARLAGEHRACAGTEFDPLHPDEKFSAEINQQMPDANDAAFGDCIQH